MRELGLPFFPISLVTMCVGFFSFSIFIFPVSVKVVGVQLLLHL